MTTSSGLGPAKGSVTVGAAFEIYGKLKTSEAGARRDGVLNIVFANADGSAFCAGWRSFDWSISVGSSCFSRGGGAFS